MIKVAEIQIMKTYVSIWKFDFFGKILLTWVKIVRMQFCR